MSIFIATISILAITGLIWAFNKVLSFKICPICAGVAGTWLWMLAAKFLGFGIDSLVLAILMAGSVVGIAYQIEKRPVFAKSSADRVLFWKTLFIPSGFTAVYAAVSSWWAISAVIAVFLIVLTLKFAKGPRLRREKSGKTVEELEKKMKNCC